MAHETTIFVGGLSPKTKEESLTAYFEAFGKIVSCDVKKDKFTGRSRGFGFVQFQDIESVSKAISNEDSHLVDGKKVDVKKASPQAEVSPTYDDGVNNEERFCKIFVGGLQPETSESSLREYFSGFGDVVDCVVMQDHAMQKSRGFGFVQFQESTSVDTVQDSRPHSIDGKKVDVKRATPQEDSQKPNAHISVKKLFVGGIIESDEEKDLQDYFSKHGTVEKVEIIRPKPKYNSSGKSFAFITFDDSDPVDKLCLMKRCKINDHFCNLQKARPSDQSSGYDRSGEYYQGFWGSGRNHFISGGNYDEMFFGDQPYGSSGGNYGRWGGYHGGVENYGGDDFYQGYGRGSISRGSSYGDRGYTGRGRGNYNSGRGRGYSSRNNSEVHSDVGRGGYNSYDNSEGYVDVNRMGYKSQSNSGVYSSRGRGSYNSHNNSGGYTGRGRGGYNSQDNSGSYSGRGRGGYDSQNNSGGYTHGYDAYSYQS